jgi:tetratricopeptide (TPR) repeat protein
MADLNASDFYKSLSDSSANVILLETDADLCRDRMFSAEIPGSSEQTRGFSLDCDFDRAGPWAGVSDLFSSLLPEIAQARPEMLDLHSLELVYVLPQLRRSLTVRSPSLTDLAGPEEKTRNYAADRAMRIVHGLIELLDEFKRAVDSKRRWRLVCDRYENSGAIGRSFFQELIRRRSEAFQLVVAVHPGHGAQVRSSFSQSLLLEMFRLELRPSTTRELSPSDPERLATDLEQKSGDDPIELQIQLSTLLNLWTAAGRQDKVLHLRRFGLYKYNTLGMYADAIHYGTGLLELAQQLAPDDQRLQWGILLKLLMSHLGLSDVEACLELAKTHGEALVKPHPEWQGQFYYMMAMFYGRYRKPRDFARAEAFLDRGLKAIEESEVPDSDRHFQYAFNRNGLAMIRNFQGHHREAIELCKTGLSRLNEHLGADKHRLHRSVLIYNIAQVYVAEGAYPEAITYYSEAIEMDPNYSEYYNERGSIFLKVARLVEALADYEHAITLSPPYYEVFTNLGQCYRLLGRSKDAVAAYSRALDLQPNQALAIIGRAKAYDELGQVEPAIVDYTAALEYEPMQWELYASRGVMYYEKHNLDMALADFNRAIELKDNNPDLFQNRATVLADLGRCSEVASDIDSALRLTTDHDVRLSLQQRLDGLQNIAATAHMGVPLQAQV